MKNSGCLRLAGVVAVAALLLLGPSSARAHGMVTGYLELIETRPGVGAAMWKLPRGAGPNRARLELDGCSATPNRDETGPMGITHVALVCPGPFAGRALRITGLGAVVGDAVVRITLADGAVASQLLTAAHPSWHIPAQQPWAQVFARYAALGVQHILSGPDHLLFVMGLVLLIGVERRREIFWTATSFTAAHSITLTATALSWLRIPSLAAEACIAGTLVLLAADIGRGDQASRPRTLAFVFGLVHGLGFAGALAEIGLPRGAIVPALLAFNVGVELGQLLFILALIVLLSGIGRATRRNPRIHWATQTLGTYAIGVLGMYWFLVRWGALLSGRG